MSHVTYLTKEQCVRSWDILAGAQWPRKNGRKAIRLSFPSVLWDLNGFRELLITRADADTPDGRPLFKVEYL